MNWYKKAQALDDDLDIAQDKWIPVNSSWMTHVAYYEPMGYLEFKLRNGKEYTFVGVPKKIYSDFMKSRSKGEFFNRIIRDRYGRRA